MGEAADKTFLGGMSAIQQKLFASTVYWIEQKNKNTSWSGTNFDANQEEFIQTTALSMNFSKQNVQIVGEKNTHWSMPRVQYQQTAFYQCTHFQ